ncbi:restriction endonuclease subunit S [Acinetobacter baumannii]|uniref:restriction endonuclease subunit S n=1 Tax=Acinetobacter baumannii TaxID=470 RepID=UPI003FA40A7E
MHSVNDEDLSGFIPMSHAPVSFFDTFKYDERNWGEIKKKYTNFADGDVIFAKVTPCFENGKAALLEGLPNGIGAGSSEFYVLRPLSSTILSKYVFSIIKSAEFLTNGERSMTGAVGLRRVPRSFVENFEVNLPPLAEQQVIADKLDTLLAQVESIKACLERIPDILKQFRQSVLAAAVTGKLTEEWRKNNKIPLVPRLGKEKFKKTLFETALSTLPELPITWEIIPAASVLEYVTSGSRGWSNYYSTSGALFLRMSNVRYDTTKLDLEDLQYVDLPENVEGKRSLVKKDDLLVSITADVGRVARVDKDFKEAYVNQHLALLRPTNEINAEFLATCIASQNIGVKQVSELKRGATKAGLGLDDIRSLAIPFPTLEEQDEIVRQVELLLGNSDVIEKQVQSASDQVNNLTQSILAKAFRGELTAEWREANPELISGENCAEALLERIKAERELSKPATKRGRGKA